MNESQRNANEPSVSIDSISKAQRSKIRCVLHPLELRPQPTLRVYDRVCVCVWSKKRLVLLKRACVCARVNVATMIRPKTGVHWAHEKNWVTIAYDFSASNTSCFGRSAFFCSSHVRDIFFHLGSSLHFVLCILVRYVCCCDCFFFVGTYTCNNLLYVRFFCYFVLVRFRSTHTQSETHAHTHTRTRIADTHSCRFFLSFFFHPSSVSLARSILLILSLSRTLCRFGFTLLRLCIRLTKFFDRIICDRNYSVTPVN